MRIFLDMEIGDTHVAKWKHDRAAAFMMFFDDCAPTHASIVYPGLRHHGLVGTFYVISEVMERYPQCEFWMKEAPASKHMVYANHTRSHCVFTDIVQAEQEIVACSEIIFDIVPGRRPRLLSYATPGGLAHQVSQDDINQILRRNHIVQRPAFAGHGAGVHWHTSEEVLAAVDRAIRNHGFEYIAFHGVGGDWIAFDAVEFGSLLSELALRHDRLWITDHISLHQYETERNAAKVRPVSSLGAQLSFYLECDVDPLWYDMPLTLISRVSDQWRQCQIMQGEKRSIMPVLEGIVRYEALPGRDPIVLSEWL